MALRDARSVPRRDVPAASGAPVEGSSMLSRRSLLMLSAAALVSLAIPEARADDASANAFVRSFGDTLIGIVNSPGDAADKQRRLAPVIERGVDVNLIAQFCLGRFWRTATPA
ncbi:MAG: hypothetical protein ACRYG2_07860, partial [Janthinobacterium lividum]